jgi:putative SOS response-associated peptidase YedK
VQEPYWRAQTDQRQSRTLASLPTFRGAYAKRRRIVPVESFFEWRAIKGARAKQPYAVAMKDRTPFTIAGFGRTGIIRKAGFRRAATGTA